MNPHPKVIILRSAGTNCDRETKFAFESFGAVVDLVHINQLLLGTKRLKGYDILAIPGGFTYGDDLGSGKILANELRRRLKDDLQRFIDDGKLIIGICNGFQVLVKSGVLPGFDVSHKEFIQLATLTTNDSSRFEDRWIHLQPEGKCIWTEGLKDTIYLPVAHGEGKFLVQDRGVLECLKKNSQIVFRYCTPLGGPVHYPENPNGSLENIAGICDRTGRVFGLMPHPERHFLFTQHPFWTRLEEKSKFGDGAKIFENGIKYARERL